MELYTLDSMLRRTRVIDKFDSLIWTERWQSTGDFELVIPSESQDRSYLAPGTWLATDVSYRCMKVQNIAKTVDDEGRKKLTIKGPSIEVLMEDRVARLTLDDLTTTDIMTITDQPADAVRQIFNVVCASGTLDPADIIPYLTSTPIFPTDGIPEPSTSVVNSYELSSVYEAAKKTCELYDLGFRLCRDPDSNMLKFDVYAGSDRTTNQDVLEPVVFSPDFDNLRDTSELTSTEGVKNIAYVFSPVGYEIVPAPDVDPDIAGFERRVLMVRADDIDDVVPADATAKMIQRGLEELSKYRDIRAFDGEISQVSQYQYDSDYYLGDLIEMRGDDGNANFVRVSEQIFVSDAEGLRSYPTFTAKELVTPNTWLGWPNITWFDLDSDPLVWEDA
jgi:hypothetical protein